MKTRTQKQYSKPYNRRIHLKNGEWSYRIARGMLWVRSPDGNATVKVMFSTFTGLGQDHNQPKVSIRPSDIKDFIENEFVPVEYPEGNNNHFQALRNWDDYGFEDEDEDDYGFEDEDEDDQAPMLTTEAIQLTKNAQKAKKVLDRYDFDPEDEGITFSPLELDALYTACSYYEDRGAPLIGNHLRLPHETAFLKLRELFDSRSRRPI